MSTKPITSLEFAALTTKAQLRRVEQLVHQALPLFGLAHDSEVSLLNYSENATYLIRPLTGVDGKPTAPRVLRINRPGYHSRSHILSELAWVQALKRDTAITTAEPLAGLDGELVQYVWHPAVPEPRQCVLMTFIVGREPDDGNRVESFQLLGDVTAQLHRHAETWKPAQPVLRERWDFDAMLGECPLWGRWQDGLGMTPAIKRQLAKLLPVLKKRVDAVGYGRGRFGLVHADLRAANLLVNNGEVAVIDFDDCGFSWFIYDLAAALSFIETHAEVPDYIDAWLSGYTRVRRLSKVELAEIPTFIMLRRMLLVAWIGSHSDTAQAQAMSSKFTTDTCDLAEDYLSHFA